MRVRRRANDQGVVEALLRSRARRKDTLSGVPSCVCTVYIGTVG